MISLALIFCTFLAQAYCFRSVCYASNNAQYRPELGNFEPENVDPNLCTHVVFSFAQVVGFGLKATEWNDDSSESGEGLYSQYVKLRDLNKDLKVLLAVGDFMDGPESYFTIVQTNISRSTFATNMVTYVRNRTFDGVTLEWAYLAAKYNPRYDKAKFLLLLKAIRAAFDNDSNESGQPRLILAVTVPAKKREIDTGYDIPEIVQQSDFISVRAFDMRTASDGVVGLSSPFLSDPKAKGDDRYLSFKWVANYYTSMGIPKDKINIGLSTFGRSFKLKDENRYMIGDVAIDDGNIGPWSASIGQVAHYEICQFMLAGGLVFNVPAQWGRYYVAGTEWFSYEDTLSITQKACFIKKEGFGGITFWTLDYDDFTGKGCREGKYPVIGTALRVMSSPDLSICDLVNSTDYVRALTSADKDAVIKPPSKSSSGDALRMICYYASWAYYRRGKGLFVPENINPELCTHIVYAYMAIQNNQIVAVKFKDDSAPWREGLFDRILKTKKVNPALKILISIGSGISETFLDEMADAENRKLLANNAVSFLSDSGFDGLEITWETPTMDRKQMFMDVIQAMKSAFDGASSGRTSPLILTVAMPSGKAKIDVFKADMKTLEATTDFISIKTYDFHGSWEDHTGLNAPIFDADFETGENAYLNLNWVANYYVSLGISAKRLNLGIPTYGRSYTLEDENTNGLYAAVTGPGDGGKYTGMAGILAYYEVCDLLTYGGTVVNVRNQRARYTFLGSQWVSFEDLSSAADKACYATQLGYGGVNVWSMDMDDFVGVSCDQGKFPLLTTVYNITQYIDTTTCGRYNMGKTSVAHRMFPDQHLYMIVMLISVVTFYTACS